MAKGKKPSYAERLTKFNSDRAERLKVFHDLLAHVRKGRSLDCFSFLSEPAIESALKSYPNEFVLEDLQIAIREAKNMYETLGHDQASGHCIGNSRSWYYIMANKYGWSDRSKVEQEVKGNVEVQIISYASKKLADKQAE